MHLKPLWQRYGININGGQGGKPGENAILIVQLRYLFASNISGLVILVCVCCCFYHQDKKCELADRQRQARIMLCWFNVLKRFENRYAPVGIPKVKSVIGTAMDTSSTFDNGRQPA